MHRIFSIGPAVLLATVSLAACTSQTQKCSNGVCDIDLSGVGSTVELGGEGGSTLELIKASGKTADVKIGAEKATLTVGEPVGLNNGSLELVAVEADNDIQLRVKSSDDSGSSDSGDAESSDSGSN